MANGTWTRIWTERPRRIPWGHVPSNKLSATYQDLTKGVKALETTVGAVLAPTRFSLVRGSIRHLAADGKSLVRNPGVGGGGKNLILIMATKKTRIQLLRSGRLGSFSGAGTEFPKHCKNVWAPHLGYVPSGARKFPDKKLDNIPHSRRHYLQLLIL